MILGIGIGLVIAVLIIFIYQIGYTVGETKYKEPKDF